MAALDVRFIIPGQPVGKSPPKFARRGALVQVYMPEKTASYLNLVKVKAHEAMRDTALIQGGVSVEIDLFILAPESWSRKKRASALQGLILPTSKPDVDNVIKGIFDAINGVVWNDDKQVVDLVVKKRYSETPQANVTIKSMDYLL